MTHRRPPIGPRLRYETLRRHNFACFYCGIPAQVSQLEIDHVIPFSLGGSNDPWNLVPACKPCNAGKHNDAPTPQMVDAARGAFLASSNRSDGYQRCTVCGVPFRFDPGDVCEDDPACSPCNNAVCDAYAAGLAHGRRSV